MKRWFIIGLCIIVGIAVILAGGGYLWFQFTLRHRLPQTKGTIKLAGLNDSVTIIRDKYGVPHIYAKNEDDLFFAFGYAVAQDRLWQIDFMRRLGQGRLSEIFGKDFVDTDVYFRLLTSTGIKGGTPPHLKQGFKAFSQGISTYIRTHEDNLPIEFTILGYKPDAWGKNDYLDVLKVVNWGLSCGFGTDLTASKILKKVGETLYQEAFPRWPDSAPSIIPPRQVQIAAYPELPAKVVDQLRGLVGLPIGGASNNWVISGEKSTDGAPLLANDTHLALTNPGFWWEVDLNCPTIHASGFAVPGVPGIPVGHNEHVAWGVTNVMVDDVDFYIEKLNPKNPQQYWFKDHWEDMKVVKETIKVKDGDSVEKQILLTRHGPILPKSIDVEKGQAISQRWAFPECRQPGRAGYALLKARTAQDVMEALRYWELPSQNFVFADQQGNIGYWCCATVPVRPWGDGFLPVPGWTGQNEWQGYVPFEKRPHVLKPEQGFIASANNKVTANGEPYYISNYWEPIDRISRITQLIKQKDKLSVDDMKAIHNDTYCLLASELTPKLLDVLQSNAKQEGFKEAAEVLSKWDFVMGEDSAAASIFETTFRRLMDNIFKDELGEKLYKEYLQTIVFPPRAIRLLIRKGASKWFDDVNTPVKEDMKDIIKKSLEEALVQLREKMGDEMDQWKWGKIHTLTFEHILGKKKPLNLLFNIGPFAVPGNHLTVNKKQYPYTKPFLVDHGVSQRMIVPLSEPTKALHVLPVGESGMLKNPHYKDQIPLYLGGKYHGAWAKEQLAQENREATLILEPKGD